MAKMKIFKAKIFSAAQPRWAAVFFVSLALFLVIVAEKKHPLEKHFQRKGKIFSVPAKH